MNNSQKRQILIDLVGKYIPYDGVYCTEHIDQALSALEALEPKRMGDTFFGCRVMVDKTLPEGTWYLVNDKYLGNLSHLGREGLIEIEQLLIDIYRLDKTPEYDYGKRNKDRDNCGQLAGVGKRWLTPKEIIKQYFWKDKRDIHELLKNKLLGTQK